ncbi:DUF3267 domain-containing protein [Peribacillus tepidiphilus]|uniref:DUF3267 domain-containing protein n=1 Tax=Peribacillus tepidiphilus TaxID=2652445 RepID=UPI0035B569DB
MNCWKSINLTKQYGMHRIMILSLFTMLLSFITIYTVITIAISESKLYDKHILWFVLGILFIYPAHKALHFLPLLNQMKKVKVSTGFANFIPYVKVRLIEPVSKSIFIIALLTPFVVITTLLSVCAYTYFHYAHYFTILLSLHMGLCVSDFIYVKNILGSPNQCYVEENEEGYEILVSKD